MSKTATARWIEGLHFTTETGSGHRLELDGPGEQSAGPRPKELLLTALCGCTGMDVASILQKMRVNYQRLEVSASGVEAEEHPKIFTEIQVTYRLWAPPEAQEKFQKAIDLSWTKYCGVTHMLNKAARMSYQVEFHPVTAAVG